MAEPNTIFIVKTAWEGTLRQLFTEEEKTLLRKAIVGEVICPRGWIVDLDQLPENLRRKIKQ